MIPLSVPNICGNELRYVTQAISDGWVSTGGPSINKFEDEFACYGNLEYVSACQSGTASLHLALIDAGVGAGDLVLAPTLTFIASINPIRYVGADPVFMDCDSSLCLDPEKLESYLRDECEIREGGVCYDKALKRPLKAIIVVHIFGNMADMERIAPIASEYNLCLIEDAAEAVGTFYTSGAYAGKMAGAIGDYGVFSLNGNKIITTGGGGMFTSPKSENVSRMRHLSTQAKTDEIYNTHNFIGYNYRMTNVQAAIGLAQLEQLETFILKKQANYELYNDFGIELLPFRPGTRPNYWFYSYPCGTRGIKNSAEKTTRDKLIRHLYSRGIQTRPVWGLCHEQPMYINNKSYKIEKAFHFHSRIVNLPCSTNLTADDIRHVSAEIKSFVE